MSDHVDIPEQQLPGYKPIDRLGAGGYGEVWRAEAPGGLIKAVKYVYGRQDGSRAASELKALDRVRGVRHPFLLSLERIEVIDGRLIVVTELADASLRERYQACAEEGLPGIPREELLGYLRDAADALDYLSREHHLQHLDIKPENLLLLAGHVKVADYGLVKSISDQTQSLVGGMTPTYAGPEVFQGRPGAHSDQYSLAILYQELLTGTLPFPGATAAELTMQHLNEEPALGPLNEGDRFAVSRALSKNPENRFATCTDFVQALLLSDAAAESPPASAAPRRQSHSVATRPSAKSCVTEVFDESEDADWAKGQSPIRLDLPPLEEGLVRYEEMPHLDVADFELTPAVFIGVGGTGGRILRILRQRITDRFGTTNPIPTLPMLLLDSDSKSLLTATRGAEEGHGLTGDETINLLLRRPQEYRPKAPQLLQWIARRWIYNIPRSQQTEGIRPLGRLALVDHARQAFQRLRRTIVEAVSDESLTEAKSLTGVDFQSQRLRVYVCGSISGGAGSGMTLDVAFAVRSILARLKLNDARVLGVLTHSSSRESSRGELARVNAYAWLSEYQHFTRPENAYPGDESCGLPPHEPAVTPFDSTYLVNLGAGLDTIALQNATEEVADYVYLDATTAAQRVFDACRDEPTERDHAHLRSFSLSRLDTTASEVSTSAQQILLQRLIHSWIGDAAIDDGPSPSEASPRSTTNHLVHGAVQVIGQLRLEPAGLASLSRSLIETHLGGSLDQLVQRWEESDPLASSCSPGEALEPIVSLFGCDALGSDGAEGPAVSSSPARLALELPSRVANQPLAQVVRPLADKITGDLRNWIVSRIDDPRERADGARRAAGWFTKHLQSIASDLKRLSDAARGELASWLDTLAKGVDHADLTKIRTRGLKQVVDLAAIVAATALTELIAEAILPLRQDIDETCRGLSDLIRDEDEKTSQEQTSSPEAMAVAASGFNSVEKRVDEELLAPLGGIVQAIADEAKRRLLSDGLRRIIEKEVARGLAQGNDLQSAADDQGFNCHAPALASCGGVLKRLAVCPTTKTPTTAATPTPWVEIDGPPCEAFFVMEAQELSLPYVAAELVDYRRDYVDLAERVHTRKDIVWTTPLDEVSSPSGGESLVDTVQEAVPATVFDTHASPCTQVLQPSPIS